MARSSAPADIRARTSGPEQDWQPRSHLELAALPTAVPCARLHVVSVLQELRLAGLADTAEVVVSEIVTNAVRASARVDNFLRDSGQAVGMPVVKLWLSSAGERVLIEVWDSDPRGPLPQTAGPEAESGRGLQLVEALSSAWGCSTAGRRGGKVVWAICATSA